MKVKMAVCSYQENNKEFSDVYIINEAQNLFKIYPSDEWMKCSSYEDIVNYFKLKNGGLK